MISNLKKILFSPSSLKSKNFSFDILKKKKTISLLFSAIEKYSKNSEIRYVGGCVRKILKSENVDDIDFAVNIKPSECIEALKKFNIKYYESGIEHGTVTAIIENDRFEITSLRKDISTDGRHAKVEFCENWYEDACRRDFTINSIYADINGNLYDPFNGKKDLEEGNVKFIGNVEKRIKEDYLRILRYVRFYLNYGKIKHNEDVKKIIKQNINGVFNLSSERLLNEFKKIIISENFLKLFKDSFSKELISLIFPQFKNLDCFNKLNDFAKNKITKVDYVFLLSLIVIDETDNVDYFLFKFNLSNFDKKRILFLKEFYKKRKEKNYFSEKNLWKVLYYNGKQSLQDLLNFEIFLSKKVNKKMINLLSFFEDKEVPIFPIKAKNIMEKYKLSEGKILGIKLKKIEEKWINNEFAISENEIASLIKN